MPPAQAPAPPAAAFHRGCHRHKIENRFGRLKCHRRVGTRDDKLAAHFLGFVLLAAASMGSLLDFEDTP